MINFKKNGSSPPSISIPTMLLHLNFFAVSRLKKEKISLLLERKRV
jgi:hypothetical protein